jgi:hypothetical protein
MEKMMIETKQLSNLSGMHKLTFNPEYNYRIDFRDILPEFLTETVTGQLAGMLTEKVIVEKFRNIVKAEQDNSDFDVSVDDMPRVEIRTNGNPTKRPARTRPHFQLQPSNQKGVGRRFNKGSTLDWLESLDGMILAATDQWPIVEFTFVQKDDIVDNIDFTKNCAKFYPETIW